MRNAVDVTTVLAFPCGDLFAIGALVYQNENIVLVLEYFKDHISISFAFLLARKERGPIVGIYRSAAFIAIQGDLYCYSGGRTYLLAKRYFPNIVSFATNGGKQKSFPLFF